MSFQITARLFYAFLCHPSFVFPQQYHFRDCESHWSGWLWSMAPGFVVEKKKKGFLFDLIFLFERNALRGFSSDHNCPLSSKRDMPHCNKQTNRSPPMIWEGNKHMGAHLSIDVSGFFTLFQPHLCVRLYVWLGTDLSSSWQMPRTAQLGPSQPQEGSGGPKISSQPLKAVLDFALSCNVCNKDPKQKHTYTLIFKTNIFVSTKCPQ